MVIKHKLLVPQSIRQLFQKIGLLSNAFSFSQVVEISNKFTHFERK